MHKVTIVALAKYLDIFRAFADSLDRFVPRDIPKIVVRDGTDIPNWPGWTVIQGPLKFSMAGNYNLGWQAVDKDSDILNFNDDVYFLEPEPVRKLRDLVYSERRIGVVSAHVRDGYFANPLQCNPRQDVPITYVKTSGNGMAAYIRREMLNEVGFFDESFTEAYGAEDADWSYRVNLAGWKVGIARDVPVKHGFGRTRATSTASRVLQRREMNASNAAGVERFKKKHGHFDVHGEWE